MIRKFIISFLLSIAWMLIAIGFFSLEQWLKRPSVTRGNFTSLESYLVNNLTEATAKKKLGSAALILAQDGNIVTTHCFGVGSSETNSPPDKDKTLYLLASVSKAVTAWGIVKLAELEKIKLDEPILPYLKRWRFPGGDTFSNKVTIKHLLSHTSGLVDGFGYSGFPLDKPRQTIEESLTLPADANMGKAHPASIVYPPGTGMSYSSAGYTILQLLVEEITGKSFNTYMKEAILLPLGMNSSNYDAQEIMAEGRLTDLAPNYDTDLKTHPYRKHTMMAGGSLRVTVNDLAKFISAYSKSNLLSDATKQRMFEPQPGTNGTWGLGHEIYIENGTGGFIVGHGGGAFPRTGAFFRLNPQSGNAVAMVMTGGTELLDKYADAWTYWETGKMKFDIRNVYHNRKMHVLLAIVVGIVMIIVWRIKRR